MGRKASYGEAEFFAAADQLLAEGKEVTPRALVALLGGSMSSIYKFFPKWEQSRADRLGPQTPIEIPEPVQSAFTSVWRACLAQANREIALIKDKAAQDIEAANRKFRDTLQEIERLENETETAAATIDTLKNQFAELDTAKRQVDTERAALAATVDQLQARLRAEEQKLQQVRQDAAAERQQHESAMETLNQALAAMRQSNTEFMRHLSARDKSDESNKKKL